MTTTGKLDETAIETWIADDPDPDTASEIATLLDAARSGDAAARADLADRFSGLLEFGTAGLRGELGGGPKRMNRAVVIRAAAGISSVLKQDVGDGFTVVIGYDARYGSAQFATDTAAVVTAAGGRALLLPRSLPTPVAAYALRALHADAAVVVTASHNPPRDNGYKVYLGGRAVSDWGQGTQIVPPFDARIHNAIVAVESVASVPRAEQGWEILGEDIVENYIACVAALVDAGPRDLRIVLTSMHGVGGQTMLDVLHRAGFTDVHVVPEQHEPDPEFPTVSFPNPEEPGALDLAFALARQVDADLILANDPDADRCSVAIPDASILQGWRQLSGDEVGSLLGEQTARLCSGNNDAVLANSVVSSRLLAKIAQYHGVSYQHTLTGFKWISRVPNLVFGYEEALGYCVDPAHVRDKDGISACLRFAALAATCKAQGRTVGDELDDLARRHGLHATSPLSIRVDDLSLISQGMANLRNANIETLAGSAVVTAVDLSDGWEGLPPTNGMLFITEAGDRVVVRPSGTEPKLKCYCEVIVPLAQQVSLEAPTGCDHAAGQHLETDGAAQGVAVGDSTAGAESTAGTDSTAAAESIAHARGTAAARLATVKADVRAALGI
ncbi:phospho-sugar mutase [Schaalia suimastitidis]|uniref:phospho-sugar mutase n=1 Tax=Schaalia suimastitidis TaxID=121163 RepID=UPI00041A219A|nr:phospho-sugar mutase [Schaalia suimastitidis]